VKIHVTVIIYETYISKNIKEENNTLLQVYHSQFFYKLFEVLVLFTRE